jgi:hypothetical protein
MRIYIYVLMTVFISTVPAIHRLKTFSLFKTKYTVVIDHWVQPDGYELKYSVTQDSIVINYNCDFVNCKDTVIYRQLLTYAAAEQYSQYIKGLRMDTLKKLYERNGYDGLSTIVTIKGDSLPFKTVVTRRVRHPTIKLLIDATNKLIPVENYRFKSY